MDRHLLGTYDCLQEAAEEMQKISTCKRRIYCVRGHEPWEVWEEVKAGMKDDESK